MHGPIPTPSVFLLYRHPARASGGITQLQWTNHQHLFGSGDCHAPAPTPTVNLEEGSALSAPSRPDRRGSPPNSRGIAYRLICLSTPVELTQSPESPLATYVISKLSGEIHVRDFHVVSVDEPSCLVENGKRYQKFFGTL
jgi:hypothetical protein